MPFFDSYGRDRVHVMLLDDLIGDREGSLRDLFGFLRVLKRPARWIEDVQANAYRKRDETGRMRKTQYVPMDPATREVLVEHFRPFNEQLGVLLGRDLSHWT